MRIRKKIISILMLSFFTTLTYSLILPTIVKADINNYTPLKFAVIIAGGFDYYMNIYMGNSIQKLDNLIHGRGVPYDILQDSLIVGPSDNPPEGRYSLQYSNGTIKYQTIVLQANRYSVKTVANRQHILSAVGNGTNLMVFGTVIAGIPEVFGLSSSEIETVNWPSSVTQTISVTKTFNDSIKSYSQGTVLTAGPASRLETRVRNSTNKTVWFNISWSNYWSIGMMNTTYGSGSA